MARVEISRELILEAMQSQVVREALSARRDKIVSRVENLIAEEGVEDQVGDLVTEDGTRPKGRPFSRVALTEGVAQEYGTSRTEQRRILGRAAEEA